MSKTAEKLQRGDKAFISKTAGVSVTALYNYLNGDLRTRQHILAINEVLRDLGLPITKQKSENL